MAETQPNPFDVMLDAYVAWAEPVSRAFSETALDRAGLAAGSTVLDIATGTGALAIPAAEAGHTVHGIDLAPGMLEVLRRRLDPYPTSTAQVMDARELAFDDDSADAAFSVLGVFFFGGDVPRALAEMRRVVRPGGVVSAVHWADPMGGPMFRLLSRAVVRTGDPTIRRVGPWGLSFLDPDDLRHAFAVADLVDVTTDDLSADGPFPAPDAVLDEMHTMFLNHPDYDQLDDARYASLREALAAEVRAARGRGGNWPLSRAHLVTGRVPPADPNPA